MTKRELEQLSCTPISLNAQGFNSKADIPYNCSIDHIRKAMEAFLDFLGFINGQLQTKSLARLESFLMPANFSSMVGEFMVSSIPNWCPNVVKNKYHNGHPDLVPKDLYPGNAILHAPEGIEIKASRHARGWQGHNPESVWLMVFVFNSNTARDQYPDNPPIPFEFIKVVGAKLDKTDWTFSGRSSTSRRTITASVNRLGYEKLENNWIYRKDP